MTIRQAAIAEFYQYAEDGLDLRIFSGTLAQAVDNASMEYYSAHSEISPEEFVEVQNEIENTLIELCEEEFD